jgi:hypothetical protein
MIANRVAELAEKLTLREPRRLGTCVRMRVKLFAAADASEFVSDAFGNT